MTSSGVLIGNIDVRSFIIEEGGIFQGSSAMNASPAVQGEKSSSGKVIDAKAHKQQKSEQQAASGGN
ncbi:hypothetical protein D3C86_2242290 [compost metagenome]